jgi:hypothetical protein
MDWLNNIETELQRIHPNGHSGKIRATARRIAGIALHQYYQSSTEDFLRLLQSSLSDPSLPAEVHSAIDRLVTRLDANFTSPSVDPVGDAMIVVSFVKERSAGKS